MKVKMGFCQAKSENVLLLLLLLLLHGVPHPVEGGRVNLARDGGYRGIVVNVGEDIPEEECAVLVENIKVTLEDNIITIHHGGHSIMKASMSILIPLPKTTLWRWSPPSTPVSEANMMFFQPRALPH